MRLILVPLLALIALSPAQAETPTTGPASGKPVPRYESLKYGEVNGRKGPSKEHRVVWTYHRRGLPVRIVGESGEWRQIEDPAGDVSWVAASTLDDRRTIYIAENAALRRAPKMEAGPAAYLEKGVIAHLEECRGGWRKLAAGGRKGWTALSVLWGAEDCPARAPE